MRDLSSRLRAIVRSNPPAAPANNIRELTVEPDVPEKRGVLPPALDVARVAEALGGRPLENKYGTVLTIDRRYEADRWHGEEQIGACEIDDVEPLRTLDPRFRRSGGAAFQGPRSPLFFDLETTGLSGGAGTVAFLVGCAWFDCGALQVRQFVLTSLAAERALLEALREQIDAAPFVASYNGRTFDAPLMDVRWAFHRLPSPFDTKPHFDMLPPARRLWKHRGERPGGALQQFGERTGCSLMAFERQLLRFKRVGDVPGFEIPSRYFHFLRTGDASGLESVLEHNRLDLVSLAVLTARAARIVRGGHEACADARESLALGRMYEQTGRLADARACYACAADTGDRATRADALSRLAISLRREKRYDEAAAVWRRVVEGLSPTDSLDTKNKPGRVLPLERLAMEALAVHHEHREKDLELAKKFAAALNDENGDEGIRRRLSRLERKMSVAQGPLLN
ncbi:MAG: ribonuclease H-like domain-containing protein [Vicinamibacterales bacterium]